VLQLLNTSLASKFLKKNGNQLWQEAIKKELKQLTDYQSFIVLDSKDDFPASYQNISYQLIFDVKYDLRQNARLVYLFMSFPRGYCKNWVFPRRDV
jgi:hypothetical protein